MATNGSSSVQINGLKETVRSLEKFGVSAEDLKGAFTKAGTLVATDAKTLVDTKSGALANTIKPSKTKNKSIVRAGSARVVYAGVQHYGGYNNIDPQLFLTTAVDRNAQTIISLVDSELDALITQYGLR